MKLESLEARQLLAGAADELAQCKVDLVVAKQTINEFHCDCDGVEAIGMFIEKAVIYGANVVMVTGQWVFESVTELYTEGKQVAFNFQSISDRYNTIGKLESLFLYSNILIGAGGAGYYFFNKFTGATNLQAIAAPFGVSFLAISVTTTMLQFVQKIPFREAALESFGAEALGVVVTSSITMSLAWIYREAMKKT